MKKISIAFSLLLGVGAVQQLNAQQSKVLIDNDKIKVTEYISQPGKDVCGKGKHTHGDHATILTGDAEVKAINAGGETEYEKYTAADHLYTVTKNGKTERIKTDGTFWASGTTHEVINTGSKPIKFYIVETKN